MGQSVQLDVEHSTQRHPVALEPAAGLIADSQGNLYGTTTKGGGGDCTKQEKGCGTVFKVATDGTTTILHAFPGHGFGKFPSGPLVADKDGNLYGTTLQGGHGCNNDGCGIVYKLAPDGTFTRFFLFPGPPLIYDPSGGLLLDEQGNLYGVTQNGGNDSVGMIYELAPDGTATYLHDFDYHQGGHPFGELVADAEGNLYGTTLALGSVYKLAPDGTFTALHEFTGGGDGDAPWAGVILDFGRQPLWHGLDGRARLQLRHGVRARARRRRDDTLQLQGGQRFRPEGKPDHGPARQSLRHGVRGRSERLRRRVQDRQLAQRVDELEPHQRRAHERLAQERAAGEGLWRARARTRRSARGCPSRLRPAACRPAWPAPRPVRNSRARTGRGPTAVRNAACACA